MVDTCSEQAQSIVSDGSNPRMIQHKAQTKCSTCANLTGGLFWSSKNIFAFHLANSLSPSIRNSVETSIYVVVAHGLMSSSHGTTFIASDDRLLSGGSSPVDQIDTSAIKLLTSEAPAWKMRGQGFRAIGSGVVVGRDE